MGDTLFTAAGWPRSWVRWVVLGLVLGCGLFVELGAPEIGLMEARNFVAAREIHAGGSWLLPTMNGELRLAKPPLPTWLVAGVMHLTGSTTDLGLLRLPSAIGACLLVVFFWLLARQLTPAHDEGRTAWLAALVLASSLLLLTVGRDGNGWDVYTYCFSTGALAAAVRGLSQARKEWGWFVLGGLLLGLSALSKGPVGLYGLVLPFSIAYAWKGDFAALRKYKWHLLLMFGLGLLVAAAWPAYVYLNHATEAAQVAEAESTSWVNRHVKSVWYYLNFPVFTGLWALAALCALVWPFARRRSQAYVPYAFALVWALVTILLLSLVPEKKERYLLPVMLPMALLVAGLLRYWLETAPQHFKGADVWLLRFWAVVLGLLVLTAPVALLVLQLPSFSVGSLRYWVFATVCVALAVGLWLSAGKHLAAGVVACTTLIVVTATTLLMPAYPEWRRRRDDAGLRRQSSVVAKHRLLRILPVYSLSPMNVKWVWAAGRVVPLVSSASKSLPFRKLPVVMYAAQRGEVAVPKAWLKQLRVVTIDSFNLSHHHADGKWYVNMVMKR
ncbi:ArnT family glycosyltransferase [Solirubrum puertoriconensis]|uniref:Glycosyltransferase RgtA/B/C/D-like domain-containing protein n=1 Tax=Solirubrum puertoriconensis TaxID=1751427 RepID=A0A9X0HKX3_SOLP1|nr:glycosyltransferase family 39 protein [Solirubrum puertoriconensis]KUG07800.1 hypothetical protein ASU33_15955 [Solirubrum puertoriconensis]